MTGKELSLSDIMTYIDSLPYNNFRKMVEHYSEITGSDFKKDMERITALDFGR